MGKGAITKHMESKKHLEVDICRASQSAGLMASWAKPSQSVESSEVTQNNVSVSLFNEAQGSISGVSSNLESNSVCKTVKSWVSGEEVLKAEIFWSLPRCPL